MAESSAEFRLSRIKNFVVLAVGRGFKIPCFLQYSTGITFKLKKNYEVFFIFEAKSFPNIKKPSVRGKRFYKISVALYR